MFLENKSGRLAAVTRLLGQNGINIRALSIADTTDFGILRLIVNEPERAHDVLKQEGFTVSVTDVIAVAVPDRPGGLAEILAILEGANMNIEYLYAFTGKSAGDALVIFRVEDPDRAIDTLTKNGIRVLKNGEVRAI